MEQRNLGRTGVWVSKLCLGCMMFGGRTGEQDSFDIIDRAIDSGINFLDTANVYSRGESEKVVGKALKRNKKRDQIVLATKVHGPMDDDDPNMKGNSRRHIIQQCEASLRRLQVDHIDLYQIHRPRSDTPIDETLGALDDLIRAGKVCYAGTSTFAAWQVVESLWVAKELGLNRFVTEQPPYHLLDRSIERELLPMAQTYGFGVIPWSPLAMGFLTGKYRRGQKPPEEARLSSDHHFGKALSSDQAFDVLDTAEKIAREKNATISQVAVAWCAAQPGITSPIIGPRTMEQLEDNLDAAEIELTGEDQKRLNEVAPPKEAIVRYYDGDFGPHQYR